jgi:hypothetical protein
MIENFFKRAGAETAHRLKQVGKAAGLPAAFVAAAMLIGCPAVAFAGGAVAKAYGHGAQSSGTVNGQASARAYGFQAIGSVVSTKGGSGAFVGFGLGSGFSLVVEEGDNAGQPSNAFFFPEAAAKEPCSQEPAQTQQPVATVAPKVVVHHKKHVVAPQPCKEDKCRQEDVAKGAEIGFQKGVAWEKAQQDAAAKAGQEPKAEQKPVTPANPAPFVKGSIPPIPPIAPGQ